jgi:hypothetical protein
MRPSTTRSILRLFHLASGIAISAFIYSPTLQASQVFAAVLQYGVIPALGISGILMWKPRLLRSVFS